MIPEKTLEDAVAFFRNTILIWEAGGGKHIDLASVAMTYATVWFTRSGSPEAARKAFEAALKSMVQGIAVAPEAGDPPAL